MAEKPGGKIEDELKAEVAKYYEQYADSPDWIEYCLNYLGGGGPTKAIIAETIGRLPREVKEFACTQCQFISVADGAVFSPAHAKSKWTIVLAETLDRKTLPVTVARSIARAWLQQQSSPKVNAIPQVAHDVEQDQALLRHWGFCDRGAQRTP